MGISNEPFFGEGSMSENREYGFAQISDHDLRTRRLLLQAGTAYGVIFGFSFAIFAWGYDAYLLAESGAVLPWSKLAFGLPLSIVIGGLAGWLAALSPSIMVAVLVWSAASGLLAMIAGHIPFEGGNLVLWFVDERLWGETIFSYLSSAATRTTLMIFINVILGVLVGYLETLAIQWAWDRSSPDGRMTVGSWLALLVAVPLAFLPALTVNGFMNRPLRTSQLLVGEILDLSLAGVGEEDLGRESLEASYRSLKPYLDRISDGYETYFVDFSAETGTWYSAFVDVVFEDGFVLRCVTVGDKVIYCDDYSKRVEGWVGDLVRSGLSGERPWLEAKVRRLDVSESVIDWLAYHQEQLSANYEVQRESQQSGWVHIRVRFDTGFEVICRFRGAQPTVVDQCIETSTPAP
jgi:hypothetical protein